eukprot:1519694-Rhodomonas_salina.1
MERREERGARSEERSAQAGGEVGDGHDGEEDADEAGEDGGHREPALHHRPPAPHAPLLPSPPANSSASLTSLSPSLLGPTPVRVDASNPARHSPEVHGLYDGKEGIGKGVAGCVCERGHGELTRAMRTMRKGLMRRVKRNLEMSVEPGASSQARESAMAPGLARRPCRAETDLLHRRRSPAAQPHMLGQHSTTLGHAPPHAHSAPTTPHRKRAGWGRSLPAAPRTP